MRRRRVYEVRYDLARRGWIVKRRSGSPIGGLHPTKTEAVAAGVKRAKRTARWCRCTVSLVIHLKDGTYEEERTYPRGADPTHRPG